MKRLAWTVVLACGFLAACSQGEQDEIVIPPEEQDLVASYDKEDTGYLSDQASEMEGVFESELRLSTAGLSETERQQLVIGLQAGSWKLRSLVGEHIKFAKNKLNTEKLHMNLSAQDIEESELTEEAGLVRVSYRLRIETIVSFEELRDAGIDPGSLTNKQFEVVLPADPREIFSRVGEACAEGYDSGSLADYNYFYYFKADKPGCDLPSVQATFTLHSLLPRKTTYPEYDRLIADSKLTTAVFFGAAGHEEEVSSWDEGVREHREFIRALEERGFRKLQDLEPKGVRYTRSRSGLDEQVDVISPTDLHALQHDTDGLFKQALLDHEIVIYNGHSFYGSLDVLMDKDAYPPDTYQILFMNSCWSYEYYTKEVFSHKASADDPEGWALADVVNNTEPAWFLNMGEETRILMTNIWAGAESGGQDGSRQFTWDAIVEAMNRHALDRYESWNLESHEIYGVSGVRTNCYDPDHPDACMGQQDEEPRSGESITRENTDAAEIPDEDQAGVRSTISVDEQVDFNQVELRVQIEHSWVGDLVIELEHAGRTVTLQSRQGGSDQNLDAVFQPIGFAGTGSAGDWTLVVRDLAARDTGRLVSWSLTLRYQPEASDPQSYTDEANAEIPDADPEGLSRSIEVDADRLIGSLEVEIDISHSYLGDLLVELEHDGKKVCLHDHQGGSGDDLVQTYPIEDFDGDNARGTWTLHVIDSAQMDSGQLNRWALTFGS
ncbi:MAG: proprotein convertase P-domain-containing protein [Deltaproteobacteria bacterium]|nr:proprotein convertase P-domain-containing protein [Deltaproteobacteria bacterium]